MHFSIQGQKQTASLYNRCVMNLKNLNKQQQIKYIAIIGVCLLIALLYLGGIAFYSSHFLPKTKIFDLDVSNQNVATVNEKLKEITPTISLVELDKNANTIKESIDMRKMNEDIDYDASSLLKKQDKLTWFISMFQQKDLEPDQIQGDFTKAEVKQIVQNCYFLNEDNIVMPKDATLAIENNKVVLKDAIDGNFIEEQEVIDLISQRMKNFQDATGKTTLDLTQNYQKPQLYQDDPSFEGKIETYQKVLDKEVTIKISDDQTISLKDNDQSDLLTFINNEIAVDQDHLSSYIHAFYKEHGNDKSGYISRSDLQKSLSKALLSSKNEPVDVVWNKSMEEGKIDVSILTQTLNYYENNTLLLSSPVVSGNGEITDETPHGEFIIRKMDTDSYLMGRDYIEHANYWIGFDPSGRVYGLHDASWRNEFGSDIYLTDPSRGCVNMPTDKIAILFDYAVLGTEVNIHD